MTATQRVTTPKLTTPKDPKAGFVVLVAGGDSRGGKPVDIANQLRPRLTEYGCLLRYHRPSDETAKWISPLPSDVDFVICCYDMASRMQKQLMEQLCERQRVPVIFCTRRWATLQVLLEAHGIKRLVVPLGPKAAPPPPPAPAPKPQIVPSGPPEDPDEVLLDLLSQEGMHDVRLLATRFKARTQKTGWDVPMLKQAILGLLDAHYLFARDIHEQLAKELGLNLTPYVERERAAWERDERERAAKETAAREAREAAAKQRALEAQAQRLANAPRETAERIERLRKAREATPAAPPPPPPPVPAVPVVPMVPVVWRAEFGTALTALLKAFPSCLGQPYAQPIDESDALRFYTIFQARIGNACTLGSMNMQLHFQLQNRLVPETPLLIELRRALQRLATSYRRAAAAEIAPPDGTPRAKTPQPPRAQRIEAEREQVHYFEGPRKWVAAKVVARLGHCSPGWIELLARSTPPSGNEEDRLRRRRITLAPGGQLWVYDLEQALQLIAARKGGKARFAPPVLPVVLKQPDVGQPSPRDPVLPAPHAPGLPPAPIKFKPAVEPATPPATLVARAFAAVRDGLLDQAELGPRLQKLLSPTYAPVIQKALAAVTDQLFTLPQAEAWLRERVS